MTTTQNPRPARWQAYADRNGVPPEKLAAAPTPVGEMLPLPCAAWCIYQDESEEHCAGQEHRVPLSLHDRERIYGEEGKAGWADDYVSTYAFQHRLSRASYVHLGHGELAGVELTPGGGSPGCCRARRSRFPARRGGTVNDAAMTTTTTHPTCPAWCVQATPDRPCTSEHYTDLGTVPASGAESTCDNWAGGATWPTVGVALSHNEVDGDSAPSVSVYLSGGTPQCQVYLRPSETRRLMALLDTALTQIEDVS